ncbi:MAG: HEAT repeat domain-containing protein, partial [Bacteroidota bacterium]
TALSSAEILSKANIEAARPEFINLSGYGDWRLRAASAFALRHFDDSASFRAIKGMLRDSHPLVRANAAFSIGALLPEGAVDTLAPAFDDPANYASGAAIAGIMQNTAIDYELCEKIFFGEYPDKLKQALAPIAARCEFDKKELRGFAKQFTSLNAGLRMAILKSMIITDYARNKEHIELLLAKEENKGIVNKAEQLIQLLSIRKEK